MTPQAAIQRAMNRQTALLEQRTRAGSARRDNRSSDRDRSSDRSSDRGWETPTYRVISLDCEISSYAPDGDGPPLF